MKISRLWHEGRIHHAACCITDLQLVVVGGVANNNKTVSDSFVMSVAAREWKQVMKMMNFIFH